MHLNNFVLSIKHNSKILREKNQSVSLPFGSEYSVYLKNTDSRRASVKVFIDGQDATENVSLIVPGRSSLDLKRFIKNGNLNLGNAFKFIERSAAIEAHRGIGAEDGLVRIEVEYERQPQYQSSYQAPYYGTLKRQSPFGDQNIMRSTTSWTSSTTVSNSTITSATINEPSAVYSAGVTAPGSVVDQSFGTVYNFTGDGLVSTLTIQLIGATPQGPIVQPVIVKRTIRCSMCNTKTKQTAKFCHECGASVELV